MTVHPVTRISPVLLKRTKWSAQRRYGLLSYSFLLLSNNEFAADRVDDVLGKFTIPPGEVEDGQVYRLLDLGPGEPRRYRLFRKEKQLIGSPWLVDVIFQLMMQTMQSMIDRNGDFLLIHAGAVVAPGGKGILIPAASGSGKTTLVTALVRTGYGFLSDEMGVIHPSTLQLHPFPRALNLKDGTLALFPDLRPNDEGLWGVRSRAFAPVEMVRSGSEAPASDLTLVVAPRYRPGTKTELIPLSRAETTKELWEAATNVSRFGGRALPTLAEISTRAPGYRLISSDVDDAVAVVRKLAEGPVNVPDASEF